MRRPNNDCKRDYDYCHSSNRAKIIIIRQQLVASKHLRNFTMKKQTETLLYLKETLTKDILQSLVGEDTLNKRKG